jgi:hypothetical protein
MKTKSAVAFVLIAVFVVSSVAVLTPMTVYAPKSTSPTLGAHFCKATLLGTWTGKTKTCTITGTPVEYSDFTIPLKATLVIEPGFSFTIGTSDTGLPMTLNNYGNITILSVGGVLFGTFNIEASATLNNLGGTISNDGIINNYGTFNQCGFFHQDGTFNDYGTYPGTCPQVTDVVEDVGV